MKSTYQQRRGRLATVPPSVITKMRDAVRQSRGTLAYLTDAESQNLSDLADGRGTTMLFRGLDTVSRCRQESDALAIVEVFRRYVLTQRRVRYPHPLEILREETLINGRANAAELEYLASPSPANRERVIEEHRAQMSASRLLIDALAVQ